MLGTDSLDSTLKSISALIAELRFRLDIQFYTTPSMAGEMRKYFLANGVSLETLNDFFSWIMVKAPDMLSTKIPAIIMSEYITSIRLRSYRGLRLLEDIIRKSIREMGTKERNEVYTQLIHEAREKFREIMRKGIVDSPEDFDVVVLAYELKGTIVTNDEGIKKLSEKMGIIVIDPMTFIEGLKRLKLMISQ
ncbi:MAG TPA: RNA ligase partner protein [Fervidicoccus fontis]|uniref:RNA-free ribonuclease P n=1 Tax=Fervidicoccus fontis TaxID=683846 RepID=A0A7C2YYR1_9CREN|nr:MAG: RNA ligase partner protein [Fervidicoccus sp.]HEU97340.1 RNA ligase partner protein [Fervidicoccus fontis]